MNVKIKRLHPDALVPQYATPGAACFDLHAVGLPEVGATPLHFEPLLVRTGLAFEIPEGHVMRIYSRSGHGFKNHTRLANSVGIIDSDYRGEVMVMLTRDAGPGQAAIVRNGDRIAQAVVEPIERVQFMPVDELSETERGAGGFGSTGTGQIGREETTA